MSLIIFVVSLHKVLLKTCLEEVLDGTIMVVVLPFGEHGACFDGNYIAPNINQTIINVKNQTG